MIIIFDTALESLKTYRNWRAVVEQEVLSLEQAIKFRDSPKTEFELIEQHGTKYIAENPVVIEQLPITELIWNTGRHYADEGQIIHAKIVNDPEDVPEMGDIVVHFNDVTRGISGRLEVFSFTTDEILIGYDGGGYKWVPEFTLEEPKI